MTDDMKIPLAGKVALTLLFVTLLFCIYLLLNKLCGRAEFKEKTADELILDSTIVGKSVRIYHTGDGKSHACFFILYASGRAESVSGKEFHEASAPLVESQKTGKQ